MHTMWRNAEAKGSLVGTQHIRRSIIAWRSTHPATVKVTLTWLLPAQSSCQEQCVAWRVYE